MATINEEGLGIVWDQVNQLVAQETSDLVTNDSLANTLDITVRHINETINSAVAAAGDNPTFTGYMSLNRAENSATGQKSVALGDANIASGAASMAEGLNSTASGNYAHAEGRGTTASGVSAHAEGTTSTASGDYSHAEGYGTTASGTYSHSEGNNSQSIGQYSHAEGYSTARSDYSHTEGDHTEVQANSTAGHAEGYYSSVRANYAHAEGGNTIASGQYGHAEGYQTTASNNASHSEGSGTTASGPSSHAEGTQTTSSGASSHAEGSGNTASGQYSHVEGINTSASGTGSHAEGGGTIAASNVQHVQGQYNIADNQNVYADIVGNGTSTSARSNAYTLDWSGNGVYAGKVTVGANPTNNMDVTTKQYVDTAIAGVGGSTVTITPSLSTGTKVADYEIDGISGELYAPAGGSGVDTKVQKLTYSEYQNLPTADKNKDTLYFVQDADKWVWTPVATSSSTNITASSFYTSNELPWKMFQNSHSEHWTPNLLDSQYPVIDHQWIMYDLGDSKIVDRLQFSVEGAERTATFNLLVQGSTDGTTFENALSSTSYPNGYITVNFYWDNDAGEWHTVDSIDAILNRNSYRYIKIRTEQNVSVTGYKFYCGRIEYKTEVNNFNEYYKGEKSINKVAQIPTDNTRTYYELLFSESNDNLEHTEGTRKSQYLIYNPDIKRLKIGEEQTSSDISNTSITDHFIRTGTDTDYITLTQDDLTLTGDTWDGIHTSLKDTLKKYHLKVLFDTTGVSKATKAIYYTDLQTLFGDSSFNLVNYYLDSSYISFTSSSGAETGVNIYNSEFISLTPILQDSEQTGFNINLDVSSISPPVDHYNVYLIFSKTPKTYTYVNPI